MREVNLILHVVECLVAGHCERGLCGVGRWVAKPSAVDIERQRVAILLFGLDEGYLDIALALAVGACEREVDGHGTGLDIELVGGVLVIDDIADGGRVVLHIFLEIVCQHQTHNRVLELDCEAKVCSAVCVDVCLLGPVVIGLAISLVVGCAVISLGQVASHGNLLGGIEFG